jgi:hypothetical protein
MKPFLHSKAILFAISSILLLTSCSKEYSMEGGLVSGVSGGTAIYTLQGTGGNCPDAQVNGTYNVGVGLQPANNIVLQVNVSTPGTYVLSTGIVNGIQFTGAGNITAAGLQHITLTGNGMPLGAGVFPYIPPVGMGCAFFVTVK